MERELQKAVSVSYTHLDVYKRQADSEDRKRPRKAVARKVTPGARKPRA